ncbi:glucose-6-phosphate dehydrogenase [Fulvimarina endophytica]|uniref:Glucose-6-phosphate 1-dehydrogenase n=1 Tax=Fulvimarina endophytica TaxID=2293836 RepID=A0A371X4I8_9HYPH|nr:glucose-6-phosphate dehydrogenase [Fulvimarina endophytica]RFC64109.1 glucose-6-phosphate dehydrogenase [Fulvimarina endophytica]
MSSQIIPVEPFDYVVFGGNGDLAARKLLPALYHRDRDGQIPDAARIIGASRTPLSDEDYRAFAREALAAHVEPEDLVEPAVARFLDRLFYRHVDARSGEGWAELKSCLDETGTTRIRAFYMAVAPSLFGAFAQKVTEFGLADEKTRVVVEKPVGRDLESAKALNAEIARHFREDQVFRIDHYLGKETVQNLMALRFANALYEPVWNANHIDHVQITVAEEVGLEGRAGYYDTAGALRDMVQNHIVQLMCLVALEPPSDFGDNALRDEKLKILRSLNPITAANVETLTVRGQYKSGASNGHAVKSYLDDLGEPESQTETFVAIKAEINNWRWAGVPFYLRTGKRLSQRMSEIVITFRKPPHNIFAHVAGEVQQNQLVLRLQPDEGMKQYLMIKDPGPGGMRLRQIPLDMTFAQSFKVRNPDAYERLLLDVIRGNQTLFMRRDEVEAAWDWIDPILKAWDEKNQKPQGYTSGTWGPSSSIALIERDGRTWHEPD